MKRTVRLLALAAAIIMAGSATSAETVDKETFAVEEQVSALALPALTDGTLIPIPVGLDDHDKRQTDTLIAPYESLYLFENGESREGIPYGYADPSITVRIGWGQMYDTDFVYAKIKIADPSQIRTKMYAKSIRQQHGGTGASMAKQVKAVVAINGDFYGGDDAYSGAIMRQGTLFRNDGNGKFDVLVIDKNGDLNILPNAVIADVEAVTEEAVNIFTFGPGLVIEGEPRYGIDNSYMGTGTLAQRMCIAQTGPLEYLLITCAGPENPRSTGPKNSKSKGMTIDQFIDLITSFPGVINAYNLDGGSSSTLVFRNGKKNWDKINRFQNKKERPLKDIIYFSTIYKADPEENGTENQP